MPRPIAEVIPQRRSCRKYQEQPIAERERLALAELLAAGGTGPFGGQARFTLVAATESDRRSLKGLGTYGVIKGAPGFIVGAITNAPRALEDFGYLLEQAILQATDLGLGTCWLGGTFSRSGFAKKIEAREGELLPAVAAVGYATDGAQDWIRRSVGAGSRLPAGQLFFDGQFGASLPDEGGDHAAVLELVRWAPSASNKQPWRLVRAGRAWHFYLQRTKGYGKGSLVFSLLRLADLQRVDMGIAMCHFALAARELQLTGRWSVEEPPAISKPPNTEYTATWIGEA